MTSAIVQGPRVYQEDRKVDAYLSGKNFKGALLAVMDGHGGSTVSDLCASEMMKHFKLSFHNHTEAALKTLVRKLNLMTREMSSGSTLSVAVVIDKPRKVSIAVLGDSPVIVYDKQGKLHISPEHNVRTNLKEREAAIKRGGFYQDGYIYPKGSNWGLQMARALGDSSLNSILSRTPKVYTITDPVWVLVASDGIFDPGHSDSDTSLVVDEVHQMARRKATADDVMEWAKRNGLQDNATALVWSAN